MTKNEIGKIFRDRKPRLMNVSREYAITIPIIERNNRLELIYQVRAETLRRPPGEISFPGGKVEPGEGFLDCAIRECMEELLIDRENIDLAGGMDAILTDYGALIYSYVVFIDGLEFEDIKPNKDEVEYLFTVPLDYLVEKEPKIYELELEIVKDLDFPYDKIPNGKKL